MRPETFEQLSERVIGRAFQVDSRLGFGYLERVYGNALNLLLAKDDVLVQREYPIRVYWEPGVVIGNFQADFLIEGCLLVELKTGEAVHPRHKAQVLNYLKATNLTLGLLLNFSPGGLQVKRVVNNFTDGPLPHQRKSAESA